MIELVPKRFEVECQRQRNCLAGRITPETRRIYNPHLSEGDDDCRATIRLRASNQRS